MGCCGSGKRSIRSSGAVKSSEKQTAKVPVVRRIARSGAATPASVQRQYIVARQACPKCGYPAMLVHISGRERQQCTNTDCRLIIQ